MRGERGGDAQPLLLRLDGDVELRRVERLVDCVLGGHQILGPGRSSRSISACMASRSRPAFASAPSGHLLLAQISSTRWHSATTSVASRRSACAVARVRWTRWSPWGEKALQRGHRPVGAVEGQERIGELERRLDVVRLAEGDRPGAPPRGRGPSDHRRARGVRRPTPWAGAPRWRRRRRRRNR